MEGQHADQERMKTLLVEAIATLCRNGLKYEQDLSVEGLIGITVDKKDVFLVSVKETFTLATSSSKECTDTETSREVDFADPEEQNISIGPKKCSKRKAKEEHTLPNPDPVEENGPDTVTYTIGRSTRGSNQLISSDGYSYNIFRRNKNGCIKWQCVVRNSKHKCYAQVSETDGVYVRNQVPHVHPGIEAADVKNRIREQGILLALSDPYKSGMSIAKDIKQNIEVPKLPLTSSMARVFNRHRKKLRMESAQNFENISYQWEPVVEANVCSKDNMDDCSEKTTTSLQDNVDHCSEESIQKVSVHSDECSGIETLNVDVQVESQAKQ